MLTKAGDRRTGLELLEDTIRDKTDHSIALGRVINALYSGQLSVQGEPPDKDHCLGEYLIHGGRVKFDLRELSKEQVTQFFNYVSNGVAKVRDYATHRFIDEKMPDSSPKEIRSGVIGAVTDWSNKDSAHYHFGINLAIGGTTKVNREGSPKNVGVFPKENGQWGHMYMHKDEGRKLMLIGVEGAEYHKKNARTQQAHTSVGTRGGLSAFCEPKHNSPELSNAQRLEGKTPLNTEAETNWATVKITPACLNFLLNNKLDPIQLTRQPHPLSKPADNNRLDRMRAWSNGHYNDKSNEVQTTVNNIKKRFDPGRIFSAEKEKYVRPLVQFSQKADEYCAMAADKTCSISDMTIKYNELLNAALALKQGSVTKDPTKIAAVDTCIAAIEGYQKERVSSIESNNIMKALYDGFSDELDSEAGLTDDPETDLSSSLSETEEPVTPNYPETVTTSDKMRETFASLREQGAKQNEEAPRLEIPTKGI